MLWRRLAAAVWLSATLPTTVLAADGGDPASLPDIAITAADGRHLQSADLWRDRPVLLTMFYNRCTGVCSPFLHSLRDAVERHGGLGRDYRIISLSIDPRDTLDDIRARAQSLGVDGSTDWVIGVAQPQDVRRLAQAGGFWYNFNRETGQYDHPAQIAAVRDGRMVRILPGAELPTGPFDLLVREVRGEYVPRYTLPGPGAWLRCVDVDPVSRTIRVDWGALLLIAPGLGALAIAAVIFRRASGTVSCGSEP